jgi:zinc transporter, ZIP family
MEAADHAARASGVPRWVLAVVPLALIAAALAALALFGGNTLPERTGPPIEELAFEHTVLTPGTIELTVRNTGPDPVTIGQVFVNDVYVDFDASAREVGRLRSAKLTLSYPWQEGSPALIAIITSTGVALEHEIAATVQTPSAGAKFYATMALLGTYVGVVPVILGMLFLPFLSGMRARWFTAFMGFTIGLLGFLAVDAYIEGSELAAENAGAFGGLKLLFLGAALAYLSLVALDRHLSARRADARAAGTDAARLASLVAIGIGLHNLGEGLAIGSAYAIGELALGAFLVIGFAAHNTTEGFAIVAPFARGGERPSLVRLLALGVIAGGPAIVGAVIGASVNNAELSTFMLGLGIGAIVQVIVQLAPTIRDAAGRMLHPLSVGGILAGIAALYLTGLLVAA